MKAMALAMILAGGTALADPVAGLWQTQPGDDGGYGHVRIAPCGAQICGVLEAGFHADGRPADTPHAGKRMIWDMEPQGAGSYRGGRIWAPDRDKTYNARMTLSGEALEVQGCILGLCRGQTWTRVSR